MIFTCFHSVLRSVYEYMESGWGVQTAPEISAWVGPKIQDLLSTSYWKLQPEVTIAQHIKVRPAPPRLALWNYSFFTLQKTPVFLALTATLSIIFPPLFFPSLLLLHFSSSCLNRWAASLGVSFNPVTNTAISDNEALYRTQYFNRTAPY